MRKHRMLFALIALGIVLLAAGLIAGFFLPFWDYSKTYAPIMGTPAPTSSIGALAGANALLAGMRGPS